MGIGEAGLQVCSIRLLARMLNVLNTAQSKPANPMLAHDLKVAHINMRWLCGSGAIRVVRSNDNPRRIPRQSRACL
eukprot:3519643-Pyramimonas_sp.AAC.1